MGVTFVLLFPFGAALIRLLNNRVPNALALHRGVQIFNLILVFIGMIMGVWRSSMTGTVGLPVSLIYIIIITPRWFPNPQLSLDQLISKNHIPLF